MPKSETTPIGRDGIQRLADSVLRMDAPQLLTAALIMIDKDQIEMAEIMVKRASDLLALKRLFPGKD